MATRTAALALAAKRNLPDTATDRELLTRFTDGGDEAAFAEVVHRHAAMVLGVCKRVLHSQADAEDASQAVFVVLAKKASATRWQASAANWLYATARKVAANARLATARRTRREGLAAVHEAVPPAETMTGQELIGILDEELDRLPPRYREPLVLCYLEGLTRDQAAHRLGVSDAALKKQLERGRVKLAGALTKRGVALGVVLLAAATSSAKATSPRLFDSILASAGGSPSASVATLAQGVAVNAWKTKMILAVMVVFGVMMAGLGLNEPTVTADEKPVPKADAPKPAVKAESKPDGKSLIVSGTVVGPDGKPVEGVTIKTHKAGMLDALIAALSGKTLVPTLAKTDADGKFRLTIDPLPAGRPEYRQLVASKAGFGPDWVKLSDLEDGPLSLKLSSDDVPVKGRVTDLEGKPVAKAKVTIKAISTGDLKKVWESWPRGPYVALRAADKELWSPGLAELPESVTAADDGKFEIKGVGRGRLLGLVIEGKGVETAACRVVTDETFDPKTVQQPNEATMPGGGFQPGPALYGPTFTHAGKPSQLVVGTVTDGKTGKPVAGLNVLGSPDGPHWNESGARATTNAEGKFTLHGIAKTDRVRLTVFPTDKSPYFHYQTTVAGKPGLTEIAAELKLTLGVLVKGRIVEKDTGKPVAGAGIRYTALGDNKFYADLMKGKRGETGMAYNSDADGRFEFVALPGAGIVMAQGETRGRDRGTDFTQVRIATADYDRADMKHLENLGEAFSAADGHIVTMHSLSGYAIIDPKATDDTAEVEIVFDRGKTVSGKVVGADGKPAAGVTGYQLTACYDYPTKLKDGTFTAIALEPDHPRMLVFMDEARKQSAVVELTGTEKGVTVKLQPWGKLTGRLLGADGKPIAGAVVRVQVKNHLKYMGLLSSLRDHTATTDAEGKYVLELPGGPAEYLPSFMRKDKYLDTGFGAEAKGHRVKPGETMESGDAKVKAE